MDVVEHASGLRDVIIYKRSEKRSDEENNAPRETLRRHVKKARRGEGVVKYLGGTPILYQDQEDELREIIFDMESKLFGQEMWLLAAELIQKETKIGFSANHAVFGFTNRALKRAAFWTTTASLVNRVSRHYSVSR